MGLPHALERSFLAKQSAVIGMPFVRAVIYQQRPQIHDVTVHSNHRHRQFFTPHYSILLPIFEYVRLRAPFLPRLHQQSMDDLQCRQGGSPRHTAQMIPRTTLSHGGHSPGSNPGWRIGSQTSSSNTPTDHTQEYYPHTVYIAFHPVQGEVWVDVSPDSSMIATHLLK